MSVFLVGSLRGSPGVTTACVLLAGCFARGVVVEADRDGGVLAVRHGLGREPGLTTLAGARGPIGWEAHAQSVGGVPVLVGPESLERTGALWSHAGDRLVNALTTPADGDGEVDVVVDVGRFASSWPPAGLGQVASGVVVVVRPVAEQLVGLTQHLGRWSAAGWPVGVVLAGVGPYRARDVADGLGVPVLGVLPEDRRAAATLADGGSARVLARSPLARAVRTLADTLTDAASDAAGLRGDASSAGEVSVGVNGEVPR